MLLENTKTDMVIKEISEKDSQTLSGFLGNLTEHVTGEMVAELVQKPAEHIVITLANADADQMLAVLYEKYAKAVMAGAAAAAKISGADSYIVILPEKARAESVEKAASELNISGQTEIIYGTCVKTAYKKDIILHPLTCFKIAALLAGDNADFCLLSVDGKEPVKVLYGTKIRDLVQPSKGLRIGNHLYGLSVLDKTIGTEIPEENGVMESVSDTQCAVNLVQKMVHTMRERSCGRCVFCREGLVQIDSALLDLMNGKGKQTDISLMEEIAGVMETESNCSLGQTGAGSVKTLTTEFESEVKEHLSGKCSAKECLGLVHYYIDPKLCKGEGACAEICPKHAVEGGKGYISVIDEYECVKCGKCVDACIHGAVKSISGRLPKLPDEPVAIGGNRKSETETVRRERKRVRPSARNQKLQ